MTASPRALIIGGSLGGLSTAIALRRIGWDVEVFERSASELKDRGAGLVMQPELLDFLKSQALPHQETISVLSEARQFLDREGHVLRVEPRAQFMTSWNTLYRQFLHALPSEHYHLDRQLVDFKQDAHGVSARFTNGSVAQADLLIGADGTNSTCRSQLLPDQRPRYVGYIAWRGVVREAAVSASVRNIFADKFTFFQMPSSHILCCLVPGPDGATETGSRYLNWVWYWNVPEGEKLQELLTDHTGSARDYLVPPGMVQEKLVQDQWDIAADLFPAVAQQLVFATQEPFLQPVYEFATQHMVFDRVCLLGDAAFLPRPHAAASTAQAVANAADLATALHASPDNWTAALSSWETTQIQLGVSLQQLGTSLGNQSQFGTWQGQQLTFGDTLQTLRSPGRPQGTSTH